MTKQKQKKSNPPASARFNPLAIEFDIEDHEVELVDAIIADPYRNATAAYMLIRPNCESYLAAKVAACDILKKPNVVKYSKYAASEHQRPQIVSREFVMLRLRHVAERAMNAVPVFDKDGQPTGEYKSDFAAANKALEMLGKQLGMFKEQAELSIKGVRPTLNVKILGQVPTEEECPTAITDKKE